MNTQTESNPVVIISEEAPKTENPMQERHCGEVRVSFGLSAEAAFMARRLEVRTEQSSTLSSPKEDRIPEDAGQVFVP